MSELDGLRLFYSLVVACNAASAAQDISYGWAADSHRDEAEKYYRALPDEMKQAATLIYDRTINGDF